jgi:hypothetical protein
MDVVSTRDGFRTLVDIVITDPTNTNLVQYALTIIAHATTVATQDKA